MSVFPCVRVGVECPARQRVSVCLRWCVLALLVNVYVLESERAALRNASATFRAVRVGQLNVLCGHTHWFLMTHTHSARFGFVFQVFLFSDRHNSIVFTGV
eukprot:GHVQ01038086.1.p1 GENE.GHVQ01038086.1~~GHVQ01038086.1.p1  ORF type:complete len:101 (+),score=6.40 GHVQ01038086.1:280-582(+)